jgi:hypothetical protein
MNKLHQEIVPLTFGSRIKEYNELKGTFPLLFHNFEMAATKPKKDIVIKPRCVLDSNFTVGGKDLRSKN